MWTNYKPFANGEYNTLWELARQIVDQYRQEYPFDVQSDETLIETEGLPRLIQWIFAENGKTPPIDFQKPEWDIFIKRFTLHFLNREISFKNASVWRVRLMEMLYQYQFFLEEAAQPLYKQISTAEAKVTKHHTNSDSGTSTRTSEGKTIDKRESTHNDKMDGTSDINGNVQTNGTSTTTTNSTTHATTEGNSKKTDNNTGNTSQTTRNLSSDMPQSIVNQSTVGNPDLQTWTYASGMVDSNAKTQSDDTRLSSETSTSEANGTDSSEVRGVDERTTTNTSTDTKSETRTGSDTSTGDTTKTGTDSEQRNGTSEGSEEIDTVSPYELTKDRYAFFMENMHEPVQTVINKCEPLFISMYVEEERMGFFGWKSADSLTKYIYKG